PSSGSDETLPHKAVILLSGASHAQGKVQPSNATGLQRRNVSPQHSSSLVLRTELQKGTEAVLSPRSSPKRCAVVPPKPQSPSESVMSYYTHVNTSLLYACILNSMCPHLVST
ncbi:hypothetical protein ILYODFUR_036193, partial [Ilyodon furcidens]